MRVLVVEDEPKMARILRRGLEHEGYIVDAVSTGPEALWAVTELSPDALVLDAMIPDLDGYAVCRRLRDTGAWMPVIMLTARDGVEDRVAGLDAGADDYLVKPFSFDELFARLRALLRRGSTARPTVLEVAGIRLDPASRTVSRDGTVVELSPKEYGVLELMMRHPNEVLTRTDVLNRVWDFAYEGRSNVVDVYVRYLREKVDRPFGRTSIVTVRGHGYQLRDDERDR